MGKGDGIIKKLCNRAVDDFSGFDHVGNTDNINMGHTVAALNLVGGWKRDSPGKRDGEDTELMSRLEEKFGSETLRCNDITCIYYARAACIIDDKEYKNLLLNMIKFMCIILKN